MSEPGEVIVDCASVEIQDGAIFSVSNAGVQIGVIQDGAGGKEHVKLRVMNNNKYKRCCN